MYDIIIIGAGIAGLSFANKISKYAKTLLIEANNNFNIRTNIFPEHNRSYLEDVNIEDNDIFPYNHIKTNYMGYDIDGIINSEEFGEPLGKVVHTENLFEKLLKNFEYIGGIIKLGEKVKKINITSNKVEVITNKNITYISKLLILATGSGSFELQKHLGFSVPDSCNGIYTHLYGSEDIIRDHLDFSYLFHLNPRISNYGPFFFNIGKGRVYTGFLGGPNEPENELRDKLERILQNYKPIQSYIKKLKWKKDLFIKVKVSKHPIEKYSQRRVLVLGEAAGLVTAFFYEGFLGGLISADIAFKVLKPMFQNENDFSKTDLNNYDKELNRILLDKYYKNGLACEYMFYNPKSSIMKLIWNNYTELINENKRLRKEIWEAYRLQDIINYDINRDKWAGEQLFKKLPAISKITLGPKFLKAFLKF